MNNNHKQGEGASRFLVDHIDLLPKGRVLDTAMGKGRNAIYLARMGFEVEGVDISPAAIEQAILEAKKTGVHIKARVADLERNYAIQQNNYDVIICFRYLQRSLIQQVKDGLKNGGMVVYETFIVDHAKFKRPKNPAYLLKHYELYEMFSDFRCLYYREEIVEGERAVASIIAKKR